MFSFLFRKRKLLQSSIRKIPISDLAPLWRDPDEFGADDSKVEVVKADDTKGGRERKQRCASVDLNTILTQPNIDHPTNNNDAWYDEQGLIRTLKTFLGAGRTSAFQYNGMAYYTIETVSKVINEQREIQNLEPMDPKAVIEFFKSERGVDSGKYLMRYESGLPSKIYLYTHPFAGEKVSGKSRPVDSTGRRLKSLKATQ